MDNTLLNNLRRVAIYGRVSTEHEAQLAMATLPSAASTMAKRTSSMNGAISRLSFQRNCGSGVRLSEKQKAATVRTRTVNRGGRGAKPNHPSGARSCGAAAALLSGGTNGGKTPMVQRLTVMSAIACDSHAIPGWQLDLMAKKMFAALWYDRRDAVVLACQMLETCAEVDHEDQGTLAAALTNKLERIRRKAEGLREMRALGDTTRAQFLSDHARLREEVETTQHQLNQLQAETASAGPTLDIRAIRSTLEQWVDLSGPVVADELVDRFIRRVEVLSSTVYRWQMDLTPPKADTPLANILPPAADAELHEIFRIQVTADDAADYCGKLHLRFFRSKRKNQTVIITV